MIQLRNLWYFSTPVPRAKIIPKDCARRVVSSVSAAPQDSLFTAGTDTPGNVRSISLSAGAANKATSDETSFHSGKIREFDEIPEAKGLPLIGTLLDYTPLRGFDVARIFDLWQKRHDQYGDIYREKIVGKDETVFCRTKEDTEKLFRAEGRLPFRTEIEGIAVAKEIMGLKNSVANLKDEDWYRTRQPMNEHMMKNKMVWKYAPDMLDISEELCTYIEKHRDEKGEVPNFDFVLDKWAFEMAGSFLFSMRFGTLRDDSSSNVTDTFEGMKTMMDVSGEVLFGNPLWKYRNRKALELGVKKIREVFTKIVNENRDSEAFSGSVLGGIYSVDSLNEEEKESLIYDLLLGSVDTTSKSSALMLYCLTLKSEVQEKLRNEVLTVVDSKSEISGRDIDGMVYANAFMKEVARLFPFVHAAARVLPHDIVLSGYRVPSGTQIMNTANSTQNRNPEYFKNPDEFLPERWLQQSDSSGKFLIPGPFGIGARSCPGRRIAMQGMKVLLMQILKNFKVEYKYDPIVSIFKLSGSPSEESRFAFTLLKR